MSSLSQFVGGGGAPRPTDLVTGRTTLMAALCANARPLENYTPQVKTVYSGACTANILKTILSLSGSGVISLLALANFDETARTHRVRVTVDGIVIIDATTQAMGNTRQLANVIGMISNENTTYLSTVAFEPLAFSKSLLIEYASSITETDLGVIGYRYYMT